MGFCFCLLLVSVCQGRGHPPYLGSDLFASVISSRRCLSECRGDHVIGSCYVNAGLRHAALLKIQLSYKSEPLMIYCFHKLAKEILLMCEL